MLPPWPSHAHEFLYLFRICFYKTRWVLWLMLIEHLLCTGEVDKPWPMPLVFTAPARQSHSRVWELLRRAAGDPAKGGHVME